MGKSMIIFAFVNCPWVKNQSSRFTIDNNFFGSTYRAARYRARSICFFGLIFTILHRFVFQLKKTFFSVAIFIFIHSVQAQIQSKKRNSLQNNNLQSQRSKMKQMLISYFISSPLHQYPSFHHYLKHQTHLQICSEPVFWLCKIIRILESFFRNATC